MPGSDKPKPEDPQNIPDPKEGGPPQARGESRSTARDVLLAAVVQALLAGLADEAAHWIVQFVVWLYEMLVSRL
ncbi:hypothetical protein [Streptomyces sp. NPDC058657]|uniref:hypothetical protein n=1 Tax=unclassified Streptomyces TaxID=2593676 RepID=UPI0036500B49